MAAITYLHVSGTFGENMVYRPRPGYESSRPGRRAEGDPAFQLVLLDREGRVLLSVAPRVSPRGCGSANDPRQHSVRGALPLHPDAVAYELRRGEIRLYGAAIAAEAPKIAEPTCHRSGASCTLRWQPCEPAVGTHDGAVNGKDAYDTTAREITYGVVATMESGRRVTVARGLKSLSHTVDLGLLPVPGKGVLYLVANDGVRSSEVKAASIDVAARPPTVHILAPARGSASIPFGQTVSVLGCCLDMGGQPCSPKETAWFLDGQQFASGTFVAALESLQPGSHRLSFAFGAADAERVEASVHLQIDEPDAHHRQWEALMSCAPVSAAQETRTD